MDPFDPKAIFVLLYVMYKVTEYNKNKNGKNKNMTGNIVFIIYMCSWRIK